MQFYWSGVAKRPHFITVRYLEEARARSEIPLDKCEKVRHSRNVFVHPEDYLTVQPSSIPNVYTLKPKFAVRDKDKEEAYISSQYDKTEELKALAEESLETAYNSIREVLRKLMLP